MPDAKTADSPHDPQAPRRELRMVKPGRERFAVLGLLLFALGCASEKEPHHQGLSNPEAQVDESNAYVVQELRFRPPPARQVPGTPPPAEETLTAKSEDGVAGSVEMSFFEQNFSITLGDTDTSYDDTGLARQTTLDAESEEVRRDVSLRRQLEASAEGKKLKAAKPASELAALGRDELALKQDGQRATDRRNEPVGPRRERTRARLSVKPIREADAIPKPIVLEEQEPAIDLPETDDIVFAIPDAPPEPSSAAPIGATREDRGDLQPPLPSADQIAAATERRRQEVRAEARRFLDELESLDGLSFQDATGYWSNTYVPGDARLRFLAEKVRALTPAPHALAEPSRQPVDPPRRGALTVALDADKRGLSGPGRVLVRVGLRATERLAGHRPAMNFALVLDLREPLAAQTPLVEALLKTFAEQRELGDRFQLFAVGPGGGLTLTDDDFRHGPIRDFIENRVPHRSAGPTLDFEQAYAMALAAVAETDDSSAPLGSSTVVVVTARPIGPVLRQLEGIAHRSAVAGVQTTAIALPGADHDELRRLVLAGQGRLHPLDEVGDVEPRVELELQSTARAVARAVRLRIRLAPGVQLVDVLGSRRLDARRAQQVREAERAVDRRLARNLGLAADRGEDDEGIQIVIPAFYAGDQHTVLLDLVAPGAGAIADVRVKFKDLVHLENGVVRSHLELERASLAHEEAPRGALERSVLRARLAYELEVGLMETANQLAAGEQAKALERVRGLQRLLAGVQIEIPGFEGHREIELDRQMVWLFADLIEKSLGDRSWTDALRYAALRKRLPAPEAL